jgi:hypothetical protein
MRRYFKPGTHIVFEVSLEQARHLTNIINMSKIPPTDIDLPRPGIADAMVCDNYGIISCFELKVTKSDFHSAAMLSFIGNYNYYVMPAELYEQVKGEIPDWIGVLVPFGKDDLTSAKKAKRQKMNYELSAVLISMLTASSNKTTIRNIARHFPDRLSEPKRPDANAPKLRKSHRYALLEDGSIEPLFHKNKDGTLDLNSRRMMEYFDGKYTMLVSRTYSDNLQMLLGLEVVKFGETEDELK